MKQSDLQNPVALAKIIAASNANTIPVDATNTSYASQTEGFPAITMIPKLQGGEAPHGMDFNGFMKLLSSHVFNIQNGAPETFNPAVSNLIGGYPKNAQLWLINDNNSRLLKSTKDDNTDNFLTTPSVIGTSWVDAFPTKDYVDNNFVTLSTDQTITGNKRFSGQLIKQGSADYFGIHIQNTQFTKGTAPTASIGGQFVFQDKNGTALVNRFGGVECVYNTNGTIATTLEACKPEADSMVYAKIGVYYPVSGSVYTYAPTPTDTTTGSGTQIATTGWVNTVGNNVVHKSGDETIAGTKTFSAQPQFATSGIRFNTANGDSEYYALRSSGNPAAGCSMLLNNDTSKSAFTISPTKITIGSSTILPNSVTPATSDNSTRIATTAYVKNQAYASDSAVVHLAGAETISGIKTFTNNIFQSSGSPRFIQKNTDCTKGTAPANGEAIAFQFADTNQSLLGTVQTNYNTDKSVATQIRVYKANSSSDTENANIIVGYNSSGNVYTSAPASDANNSIVTTVNKSKAANGYFKLGNGLIVQWGKVTKTQAENQQGVIPLPIAFTSTNYCVTANTASATEDYYGGWMRIENKTTQNFTAFCCNYENSHYFRGHRSFNWIAIGY